MSFSLALRLFIMLGFLWGYKSLCLGPSEKLGKRIRTDFIFVKPWEENKLEAYNTSFFYDIS